MLTEENMEAIRKAIEENEELKEAGEGTAEDITGLLKALGEEEFTDDVVNRIMLVAKPNDDGKIKYQTIGYVGDRCTGDSTGGRGAILGMYATMGAEVDTSVGSLSLQLVQKLVSLLPGTMPRSFSRSEDLSAWWVDERKGAEA